MLTGVAGAVSVAHDVLNRQNGAADPSRRKCNSLVALSGQHGRFGPKKSAETVRAELRRTKNQAGRQVVAIFKCI